MTVDPYATRIASPTAIPIIRATVTVADAIPKCAPTDRFHGRRRARRHRQPEPEPEGREGDGDVGDRGLGRPRRHPPQRADAQPQPDERDPAQRQDAHGEPRYERTDRHRARQRPEGDPLLVRAAVEHPVDEDGAADDRRREGVAGEERDEGCGREGAGAEQPRIEERVRPAHADEDGERRCRSRRRAAGAAGGVGRDPGSGRRGRVDPMRVSPSSGREADAEQRGADQVDTARPARRLPPGARRPREHDRDEPDRDVDVEDPPPRGTEPVGDPGVGEAGAGERVCGWIDSRIAAPTNGPAAIPRNVRAPMTPSARARAGPSNRWLAAAVPTGTRMPPPTAWTSRAAMSWSRVWAAPGQSCPTMNTIARRGTSCGRPTGRRGGRPAAWSRRTRTGSR